jgi:antibiotic biosynthesis monooxygenase (ABM) superfamily enzyme
VAAAGRPTQTPPQYRKKFVTVLTGFVILFVFLDQTPSLLAGYDLTAGFLLASAVLVAAAVGADMLLFGRALPAAWRNLGFGRPEPRTLLVTTLIGVLVMGFFPIFSWVTGASFGSVHGSV